MLDTIIKDANIIDGSGAPAYKGSVGIDNGKITLDTNGQKAQVYIDGKDKYLTPGLFDVHSHGDLVLGEEYARYCKTVQGVTTEITGQCGMSMFPVNPERMDMLKASLSVGALTFPEAMTNWTDFNNYLEYADRVPKTANTNIFMGHGTLRIAVMGFDNRKPTTEELDRMKALLEQAMQLGAMGLSSALALSPSGYADTDELVALCEVIRPYGGIYTTHIRNESFDVVNAVAEALEVGKRAHVPVNISHHKCMGRKNWGKQKQTMALIEQAQAEGVQVTCDQYPYTCSMVHLNLCMPSWYFKNGITAMAEMLRDPAVRVKAHQEIEDPNSPFENLYLNSGGWDGVFVCSAANTPLAVGKTISEYAKLVDKDPFDAFFDIMVENKGISSAVYSTIGEDDIFDIIRAPYTMVGSDGLVRAAGEKGHPRGYASCTHAICYFVKDNHLFTLEEMIHKLTALPAKIYGCDSKGLIREGYDADLILFDYDELRDLATYTDPCGITKGLEYVIVNGQIVYKDYQLTGATPGKVIRHKVN